MSIPDMIEYFTILINNFKEDRFGGSAAVRSVRFAFSAWETASF
jgi:hypothetical protein